MKRDYPEHPIIGVGAVIVEGGRVLLVRRDTEPLRGEWSVPGGMLELGEKLRDGVRREALEETGVTVEPGEALDLLRERIRLYNESTGVANTPTSGYHETITRFYVGLIADYLAAGDLRRPIDELAAGLLATMGERDLPLRYYSRERLFSSEARLGWLAPDLQPLPGAIVSHA